MTHTALPSQKGQITLPAVIRNKYHISKETPVTIEDNGNGVITLRVMQMVDHDSIQYYENEKMKGLRFKDGIDPKVLADAIKKIDG